MIINLGLKITLPYLFLPIINAKAGRGAVRREKGHLKLTTTMTITIPTLM